MGIQPQRLAAGAESIARAATGALDDAFPHIDGVTHRMADVDGVRLHYAEAGQGEALLLIHGFPQNWYMWRDVIPELSKHFRVIAPDMRGAGWSDAPASGFGKAQIADELARFMDVVGAPKARVMGHDWGGFVGFQLSLRHPDKVKQYLALDIATPWPNRKAWTQLWKLGYQPVLGAPLLGAALLQRRSFVKAMLWAASTHKPWSAVDVAMFAQPYRSAAHAEAGSQMYRTFLTDEALPWMRGDLAATRLEPETLLLVGGNDFVIKPKLIAGYERYSRDMHAEFVPGVGHFMPEERPDIVVDRALQFFGSDEAATVSRQAVVA